jgi:hypothetical protein
MKALRIVACLLALAVPATTLAATPAPAKPVPATATTPGPAKAGPAASRPAPPSTPLPAWDQLSAEQRELLVAPLRERWNAAPDERPRMLERAQRWKSMPTGERERARRGMRRFEDMSPQQREHARAIFSQTRDLPPEQRRAFFQRWEKMSAEERQAWLREHPAPARP